MTNPDRPTSKRSDRRVDKSKQALHVALVELMIEKGYEGATIAEIAERANVGRSTFYAHYADKEDLLRESLQGLRTHLVQQSQHPQRLGVHPVLQFTLPMFEHLREREALVRALIGQRSAALDLVHATLAELVTDLLAQHAPGAQTPHVLTAEHIVGSFLAVSRWWLNNPAALSAAEVDAAFQHLMTGKELGMAP
jgi:AcrR family transcriptional regulator